MNFQKVTGQGGHFADFGMKKINKCYSKNVHKGGPHSAVDSGRGAQEQRSTGAAPAKVGACSEPLGASSALFGREIRRKSLPAMRALYSSLTKLENFKIFE